jgi:hypothetical protein
MENVTLAAYPVGAMVNSLYVDGLQTCIFHNVRAWGSGGSPANDAVLIGGSPAPVSTTVTFDGLDVEGSLGACVNAGGSSTGASIVITNSTLENCKYGVVVATGTVLTNNHFEHSNTNSIYVPPATGALIQSSNNTFQQCGEVKGSTFFSLNGATTMYSSNDVTDLSGSCTLYHAPTGSHVYTTGPQFPDAIFPEGKLNSGDLGAIAAGVLARHSYQANQVGPGDFTTQPFRGNEYDLIIAGNTRLHIGENGIGLPVGETITFVLRTNGSSATLSSANTGDYPISGTINDTGRANGTFQVVVLRLDSNNHFVVASSPGWSAY